MALLRKFSISLLRHGRKYNTFKPRAEHIHNIYAAEDKLKRFIEVPNPSKDTWEEMRNEILEEGIATSKNIDTAIMDFCHKINNKDAAFAYYMFLKENNYNLNIAVLLKVLAFLAHKYKYQRCISESDTSEILHIYEKLQDEYDCLHPEACQHLISALCLTDKWKDSFKYMDTLNSQQHVPLSSYSSIIAAAFYHKENDIAWEYLEKLYANSLAPYENVFNFYLDNCSKDKAVLKEELGKLFSAWEKTNYRPSKDIINRCVEICHAAGYTAKYTNADKIYGCHHCNQKLLDLILSPEEFKLLSSTVMKRCIIESDIYTTSNPIELGRFQHFLNRNKPFDVVLDGLNIMYYNKRFYPDKLGLLPKVVEYFKNQGRKVLVIGRQHMLRTQSFHDMSRNAVTFLFDNISKDDPYMLYATFLSGPDTKLVSLDLMRQHKFLLQDNRLRNIFLRWQMSHQYFFQATKNKLYFKEPLTVCTTAQQKGAYWHVPYQEEITISAFPKLNDFPKRWVCFKF